MLFLNPSHTHTHTLSHTHKNMQRSTIEEKVVIIYARARPFVYLCMAAGESRDHFNHKGKSVLISSLQRCQDDGMMQQRRFDVEMVDGAIKRHHTSTLQPNGHRTFCGFGTSNKFHTFSPYSLWYSGSHSQRLW